MKISVGQNIEFLGQSSNSAVSKVCVYTSETQTSQFQNPTYNKKFLFRNKITHKRHLEEKKPNLL